MSSSDSDDGFYSNVVKKMRIAREQCRKNFLVESAPDVCTKNSDTKDQGGNSVVENNVSNVKNTEKAVNNTIDDSITDSIEDDLILDEIIAKNSKPTRGRGRGRGRGRKLKETTAEAPKTCSEAADSNTRGRGRGRGGKRGRASKNNVTDTDMLLSNALDTFESLNGRRIRACRRNGANSSINDVNNSLIDILSNITGNRRGRGRKRSRQSYYPDSSIEEILQNILPDTVNEPARGRQQGRGRNTMRQPVIMPVARVNVTPSYPTFSVGNTDEYHDKSDDVPLFSKPTSTNQENSVTDDVVLVEETDSLDDNELLPVKVIWKSLEVFKFTIRKYQKLTQIFESFAQKENIGKDKLLFTYNNKILTCDDTPASIDYNIAKFIDGGVVSHSIKNLVHDKAKINGIQIKFQCQNIKKPLEVTIGKDEKVLVAMTQCAERLELPLNKLKFEFDGDIVTGNSTPQQMGLENGDCIDVVIHS